MIAAAITIEAPIIRLGTKKSFFESDSWISRKDPAKPIAIIAIIESNAETVEENADWTMVLMLILVLAISCAKWWGCKSGPR